jgi:hypothetical protein
LHVLSITNNTRTWLSKNGHVRVLHVFDDACNLIDANSQVVSLVTPRVGAGPFNLVVPPTCLADHIAPSSQVTRTPDKLIAGNLMIDTTRATTWNPVPPWETLREERDHLYNQAPLLAQTLQETAPPESLAGLVVTLPEPASKMAAETLHTARAPAKLLIRGLEKTDRCLCLKGAKDLAGLGAGLTPAGDDWLVGCVLAAWAGFPRQGARATAAGAAETTARHTTPLSAAWLRAAACGECSAAWHALFEALLTNHETLIHRAASAIVRQGHTSGADALAGFVATLTAKGSAPMPG